MCGYEVFVLILFAPRTNETRDFATKTKYFASVAIHHERGDRGYNKVEGGWHISGGDIQGAGKSSEGWHISGGGKWGRGWQVSGGDIHGANFKGSEERNMLGLTSPKNAGGKVALDLADQVSHFWWVLLRAVFFFCRPPKSRRKRHFCGKQKWKFLPFYSAVALSILLPVPYELGSLKLDSLW